MSGSHSTLLVSPQKLLLIDMRPSIALNISSSEIIQKVEVLDVVGRVILSKTLNSSNYILDVSNLNSNVYFINYSINGVVNTKKVIVNY